MTLLPGYYANVFEVTLQSNEAEVVICKRSKYPDLRPLRAEIEDAQQEVYVYAPTRCDFVYGYGKDKDWLHAKGFADKSVSLQEEPQLAGRMIQDAIISRSKNLGYSHIFLKGEGGRCKLFSWNSFTATTDGKVRIFTGYDIRTIFLHDESSDLLRFNVVVDACYALRSIKDEPLNFHEIVSRFGSGTLRQVRQIQKDLIPTGINTEVSRQRLGEQIIPFAGGLGSIALACGIKAEVVNEPSRIIVGAENESLW